jgi:hypothetical protein
MKEDRCCRLIPVILAGIVLIKPARRYSARFLDPKLEEVAATARS